VPLVVCDFLRGMSEASSRLNESAPFFCSLGEQVPGQMQPFSSFVTFSWYVASSQMNASIPVCGANYLRSAASCLKLCALGCCMQYLPWMRIRLHDLPACICLNYFLYVASLQPFARAECECIRSEAVDRPCCPKRQSDLRPESFSQTQLT